MKACASGTGRLTSQKRVVTTFPVKLGSLKGRAKENLNGMKKLSLMIAGLVVGSLVAMAADVSGKWTFENKTETKKGEVTMKTTLDLKAEGETLTGKVTTSAGRREVTADVAEGKIEGNKITFTTTQSTRKGDTKIKWEATLEGDSLKGTRSVEGRKRGQEFTAKRAAN